VARQHFYRVDNETYKNIAVTHLEEFLRRNLELEYLDLYLMHFPFATKQDADTENLKEEDVIPLDLKGVWGVMESFKEQGLAKAVGVSNFSVKRLQELYKLTGRYPAVNQVCCSMRYIFICIIVEALCLSLSLSSCQGTGLLLGRTMQAFRKLCGGISEDHSFVA
jgi:aryl-alcohol dehydrogenase-like predicted oxidoreductase